MVLSVLGVVLAFVRRPSRSQLLAQLDDLQARVRGYEGPSTERVTFLLRRLLLDLGVPGPRSRASVFIPTADGDGRWQLIARYSADAVLTTQGRSTYAPYQGLVVETWKLGQSYRSGLPSRRKSWDTTVSAMFNIPAETVEKLRMQSRSYGCIRIDRPSGAIDTPVGVLIVESLDPTGIRPEMVDQMLVHTLNPLLSTECSFQSGLQGSPGFD